MQIDCTELVRVRVGSICMCIWIGVTSIATSQRQGDQAGGAWLYRERDTLVGEECGWQRDSQRVSLATNNGSR
jgi:hypothetical protein